jgi:predicted Zn-dependent protease
MAVGRYYFGTDEEFNAVTGETQRIGLSVEEEIAMGLHAAPTMMQRHGGLHTDAEAVATVERIGQRLAKATSAGKTDYNFEFHLLADSQTVNAFALPGGQVFLTMGLLKLLKTEDEIAGVLGHEIGHVVGRHSAEQIAKAKLTSGLTTAVITAATETPSQGSAQLAQLVNQLVNTRYGRDDELESDRLGVRFLMEAGYDPEGLIGVMKVLEKASGGSRQPEFLSTHPSPTRRTDRIAAIIEEYRRAQR